MTVAEPHATFTARDGRVAVLWSHGRLTEHNREGAKPARTVGKHFDSDEAADWARKHGFEMIGLPGDVPRVLVAPLDDIDRIEKTGGSTMSTTKTRTKKVTLEAPDPPLILGPLQRGKIANAESIRRSERVSAYIARGLTAGEAIKRVASEVEATETSITANYYGWRKKQFAAGRDVPIPVGGHNVELAKHRYAPPTESEPEPFAPAVTVALEPPSEPVATVASERENGHGPHEVSQERVRAHAVSPVAGEEVDPLRQADVSNREIAKVLTYQWQALTDARAALEQELEQTMDQMARIEAQQGRVRQAAETLGVDLSTLDPAPSP